MDIEQKEFEIGNHLIKYFDAQDALDDVSAVENEDLDGEIMGKERNSRTWTSSKRSSRTT